jgi:H2-forming N5,N10-methylenetetrahydromethanopterin dehydrogenase-like enzyme
MPVMTLNRPKAASIHAAPAVTFNGRTLPVAHTVMSDSREKPMGCVMITCSVTGKAVSTGIETELATLQQAVPFVSSAHCAACGAQHQWSHSDAWICETTLFKRPSAV